MLSYAWIVILFITTTKSQNEVAASIFNEFQLCVTDSTPISSRWISTWLRETYTAQSQSGGSSSISENGGGGIVFCDGSTNVSVDVNASVFYDNKTVAINEFGDVDPCGEDSPTVPDEAGGSIVRCSTNLFIQPCAQCQNGLTSITFEYNGVDTADIIEIYSVKRRNNYYYGKPKIIINEERLLCSFNNVPSGISPSCQPSTSSDFDSFTSETLVIIRNNDGTVQCRQSLTTPCTKNVNNIFDQNGEGRCDIDIVRVLWSIVGVTCSESVESGSLSSSIMLSGVDENNDNHIIFKNINNNKNNENNKFLIFGNIIISK
eukprot:227592_1